MDTEPASADLDGRDRAETAGGGLERVAVASASDAGGHPTWT
jgi:hypothetical protein